MNSLSNLQLFFNNALLTNKKFMLIPYTFQYYTIIRILKSKNYIKNFICIMTFKLLKCYLLIEFKYINTYVQKFKIIFFRTKLKFFVYSFKDILKLSKFDGLFLFHTSLGILTLEQLKLFKIGGFLILYIY